MKNLMTQRKKLKNEEKSNLNQTDMLIFIFSRNAIVMTKLTLPLI